MTVAAMLDRSCDRANHTGRRREASAHQPVCNPYS